MNLRAFVALFALCTIGICSAQPDPADPKALEKQTAAQLREMARTYFSVGTHSKQLRYENISDTEVREIQVVLAGLIPNAAISPGGIPMTTIGSVYDGCSCEEGPACSVQVYAVAHQPSKDFAYLLSRIDDHWALGPKEAWSIRFQQFQAKYSRMRFARTDAGSAAARQYLDELQALYQNAPRCEAAPSP
jgi:hypothetical protein